MTERQAPILFDGDDEWPGILVLDDTDEGAGVQPQIEKALPQFAPAAYFMDERAVTLGNQAERQQTFLGGRCVRHSMTFYRVI